MHSRRQLTEDLRTLGVRPGDVVMVHASVRAVGEVAGGPDEIHLALKDAVTPDGTIFMYASCPQYVDEVGRGGLSAEEEMEILEKLPAFDARTGRSDRSNGALVEFLRTWPDSVVNDHPARFVAWGAQARHLIASQPWDFAFGRDSLLERFVQLDGRVLLLGSDHDNVTFLHYAEHVADIPDKRVARFQVPVLRDGERIWLDMLEFDTSSRGAHPNWSQHIFADIVDSHLLTTGNRGAMVGNAHSYLMDARPLLDHALDAMGRIARDPRAGDVYAEQRERFLAGIGTPRGRTGTASG
jgi:aminoglycoside 3-N-acetyltransferase